MELAKLAKDEIRSYDAKRLGEVENDLRREMAMMRMEYYTDMRRNSAQVRGLKKNLARVMTYRNELLRKQSK